MGGDARLIRTSSFQLFSLITSTYIYPDFARRAFSIIIYGPDTRHLIRTNVPYQRKLLVSTEVKLIIEVWIDLNPYFNPVFESRTIERFREREK